MNRRRAIAHTNHEGGKWVLNNGNLPPRPAAILMSDGVVVDFMMYSDPPIRHYPMSGGVKFVKSQEPK